MPSKEKLYLGLWKFALLILIIWATLMLLTRFFDLAGGSAYGQSSNRISPSSVFLTLNTNGVVLAPTNFWNANSNSIAAVAGSSGTSNANAGLISSSAVWASNQFYLGTNVLTEGYTYYVNWGAYTNCYISFSGTIGGTSFFLPYVYGSNTTSFTITNGFYAARCAAIPISAQPLPVYLAANTGSVTNGGSVGINIYRDTGAYAVGKFFGKFNGDGSGLTNVSVNGTVANLVPTNATFQEAVVGGNDLGYTSYILPTTTNSVYYLPLIDANENSAFAVNASGAYGDNYTLPCFIYPTAAYPYILLYNNNQLSNTTVNSKMYLYNTNTYFFGTFQGSFGPANGSSLTNLNAPVVINVKNFGAVGDGSANDTAAIQAAFDYSTNHYGAVYFPGGNYIITNVINILPNQAFLSGIYTIPSYNIYGDAQSLSVIYQQNTNKNIFQITNDCRGVQIHDLAFRGAFDGTHAIATTGIYVPSGAANGQNYFANLQFAQLNAGIVGYFQDSSFVNVSLFNVITNVWLSNPSAGADANHFDNFVIYHHTQASAIAASGLKPVGIRVDAGAGHVFNNVSINMTSNSVGFQMLNAQCDLLGVRWEMDNGAPALTLKAPSGNENKATLIDCQMQCPGSYLTTNTYAVEIGTNDYLTVVGSLPSQGYGNEAPIKKIATQNSQVVQIACGNSGSFNPILVNEFDATGTNFLYTRAVNPFANYYGTATLTENKRRGNIFYQYSTNGTDALLFANSNNAALYYDNLNQYNIDKRSSISCTLSNFSATGNFTNNASKVYSSSSNAAPTLISSSLAASSYTWTNTNSFFVNYFVGGATFTNLTFNGIQIYQVSALGCPFVKWEMAPADQLTVKWASGTCSNFYWALRP